MTTLTDPPTHHDQSPILRSGDPGTDAVIAAAGQAVCAASMGATVTGIDLRDGQCPKISIRPAGIFAGFHRSGDDVNSELATLDTADALRVVFAEVGIRMGGTAALHLAGSAARLSPLTKSIDAMATDRFYGIFFHRGWQSHLPEDDFLAKIEDGAWEAVRMNSNLVDATCWRIARGQDGKALDALKACHPWDISRAMAERVFRDSEFIPEQIEAEEEGRIFVQSGGALLDDPNLDRG